MTKHTKESIIDLLKNNDKAIGRALVAIHRRQNQEEQISKQTKYRNGRGFRPAHAKMGSNMALYYLKFEKLTPRQINYWRVKERDGRMRIEVYASQLLDVVKEAEGQS